MVNNENMTNAKTLLAEATGRGRNEIPDNSSITNFDGWDSLSHMRLILAMEEKLGKELAPEVIMEIETLEDIAKYLT